MPLSSGASFAGFTIVRLLGSGGMGEVYLAEHPSLPRRDALKILPAEVSADPGFRERFNREADVAATLDHPHIVGVHDYGEHLGQLWISMDYIDGADVGRLMRQGFSGGMSVRGVVEIVTAVASALDYANQTGLIHRDVKPANILISVPHAGEARILLAGFGIARPIDDISGLTATNVAVGTGSYSAPEQLMGNDIDGRADQYALAATAYHLLTGSPPFEHTIGHHPTAAPPRMGDSRPELAPLDPVLSRALSMDPGERFANSSDFADTLAEAAGVGRTVERAIAEHGARSRNGAPRRRPQPRRRAALVIPAVLVLVGAIVFVGFHLSHRRGGPSRAAHATATATGGTPANRPVAPVCGDDLARMDLRDKLGQLLMVGVTGADDAETVVTNYHVGGIFIGSKTDKSMLGSLGQITSIGPLPVAVSVDEEGGRVSRLSSQIGEAPSARVLAASSTPDEVYALARQRGEAMRALGITIDFAPVADVSDQPDGTVIGDRSFSSDPAKVAQYAGAYARGLRAAGVLPVLKHFPGHGHGSGDTHKMSVVTPALSQLETNDLVPYKTLLNEQPVAVMVGHMQVPDLTGGQPASMNQAAYALLRSGSYGGPPFGGVVFTDDLSSMRAISDRYGVAEAVLTALRAGADNALWITTDEVPAVLDRLENAVHAGELSVQDVDQKVGRMAAIKGRSSQC
jgi:beta-glucosidase-like glycosyl hydrolase